MMKITKKNLFTSDTERGTEQTGIEITETIYFFLQNQINTFSLYLQVQKYTHNFPLKNDDTFDMTFQCS